MWCALCIVLSYVLLFQLMGVQLKHVVTPALRGLRWQLMKMAVKHVIVMSLK